MTIPPLTVISLVSHPFSPTNYAKAIFDEMNQRLISVNGTSWLYKLSPDGSAFWVRQDRSGLQRTVLRGLMASGADLSIRQVDDILKYLEAMADQHSDAPRWDVPKYPHQDASLCVRFLNGIYDPLPDPGLYPEDPEDDAPAFFPPTPEHFDPTTIPHTYTPSPAPACPRWHQFLSEIADGRPDFIRVLQNWFGYCLLPTNTLERVLFLQGVPRSGKTTVVEILKELIGHDNFRAFTMAGLASQFGMQSILHARVISLSETQAPRHLAADATSNLKKIIGRDTIFTDIKRKDPISVRIPAKVVITSNDIPEFDDTSFGFTSKLVILPFTRTFSDNPDLGLRDALIAELPGILQWALDGARTVCAAIRTKSVRTLFPELPTATHIRDTISSNSDPVAVWASESIIHCSTLRPVPIATLYSHFESWIERNFGTPTTKNAFARSLNRLAIGTSARCSGGTSGRHGIALRSAPVVQSPAPLPVEDKPCPASAS